MRRRPDEKYLAANTVKNDSPCWPWRGYVNKKGYPVWSRRDGKTYAHRVSYALYVGEIPPGAEIHHKCFNRACVNPDHLEAVTRLENMQASARARTHCINGHEYTEKNTSWRGRTRVCRECRRVYDREKMRRIRGSVPREEYLAAAASRTHCENGHEFTPENTYWHGGRRRCRECCLANARKPGGYKDPSREPATHCKNGHEYTPENTYTYSRNGREYRYCRECNRLAARRASKERRKT